MELLKAEYEKYFGLKGSSAFAQKLFKSMTECFDWRFFLEQQNQVQKSHLQSFQNVVDSLQTCLEKAGWPDPVQFPWLERTWRPKCKERDQAEYFCLIKRLKKEYRKSLADGNFNVFNDLVAYEVTPVSLSNFFLPWVDQLMAQSHILRSQPVAAVQSFSVVSAFLVGEKPFLLQPDSLRKTGHSGSRRGQALQRGQFRGGLGSFGSVRASASPGLLWGKQVRVKSRILQVNPAKVARFLDCNRELLLPRREDITKRNAQGHCWHAVFVHHCARCCCGPDAALERWFSIIHLVFDSGTKLAPDRVVNRLMLKEAGVSCTGGERDEHLISSLVQIFMQTLKKRPRLSRTGVAKRRRLGEKLDGSFATQGLALAANEQAAASGRDQAFREVDCPEQFEYHATDLPQQRKEWRQNHKPSLLDPGARNALQAAAGGREELSATTSLRALPFQVEDITSVRKHRAPSDLQEKMNQWLQSEASSSWHDKRAALWE